MNILETFKSADGTTTNLDDAYEQYKAKGGDLDVKAFKLKFVELASAGLGVCINGRGEKPDRFIWGHKLTVVK